MNERDLLKLKDRIDKAKAKVSELVGRKDYLFQELKKQWKCNSIEDAQALVKTLESDIEKLDKQIDNKTSALEERLNA